MQTRFIKTDEISGRFPAIYIAGKSGDFSICGFNDSELAHVKSRINKGDDIIFIDKLSGYTCLVINDESRSYPGQLENIRKLSSRVFSIIKDKDHNGLLAADLVNDPELILAFVEGLVLSNYRFDKYMTVPAGKSVFPPAISLFSSYLQDDDIEKIRILCEAVYIARDLVNEPLSHLNAVGLAERIEALGARAGFSVEVMNKPKIESLRMGGLLAVNRGSIDPPTFSVLEWKPEKSINDKPFVLVGKGVVYDTGGLSLKPTANSMDYMKCDMAGAAVVAGTLYSIASCRLPVHVIGLVPATDNRPDGNAIVPGDIITMYDGTTVEVMNTDAEGRLLLGDALSWSAQYDPALVIDIATLTGSAAAAIGVQGMVAMQKSAEKWYHALEESGFSTHERLVEFPLWDEYREMLKSDVADIKNIGGKEAGTITAGKFLEHFTSFPWIHLDIAGPAFIHTADAYKTKGGTGYGVRLLFDFFRKYSGKSGN
ncbi:MAG: leucyl aminopeptidase family protein [Bacteroidales bacterium]